MTIKELYESARKSMSGFCSICPVCDGKVCAGKVPGMGGAITGSSFAANTKALSDVKLNMRTIHDSYEPSTAFNFFGTRLKTPIMAGPMTNGMLNCGPMDEYDYVNAIVKGCDEAGSLGWIGDPCDEANLAAGLKALSNAGRGVAIVKPRMDLDEILGLFERAVAAGAIALGTDVDGAGLITMKLKGQPVGPKPIAALAKLRAFAPELPFIVKGIMTPDDAKRCVDAGADCIVVSNHGGRVLDGVPGVAQVLPGIAKAVGKDVMLLADGSVRSGVDALKLLALGADGVLVGRPLCWGAYGNGVEGVKQIVSTYTTQLYQAMIMTGCASLEDIDERLIF